MRYVSFPAAAMAALLSTAAAAEPSTTRIETRPFYGATVTLESGVRVFRPLPSHDRVIINPGGKTPLSLGFEDIRSTSNSYNYNYNSSPSGAGAVAGDVSADGYPVWTDNGRFRGRHRGHRGGAGPHHGGGSHGSHGGSGGGAR
jgi:hypothetical protein